MKHTDVRSHVCQWSRKWRWLEHRAPRERPLQQSSRDAEVFEIDCFSWFLRCNCTVDALKAAMNTASNVPRRLRGRPGTCSDLRVCIAHIRQNPAPLESHITHELPTTNAEPSAWSPSSTFFGDGRGPLPNGAGRFRPAFLPLSERHES